MSPFVAGNRSLSPGILVAPLASLGQVRVADLAVREREGITMEQHSASLRSLQREYSRRSGHEHNVRPLVGSRYGARDFRVQSCPSCLTKRSSHPDPTRRSGSKNRFLSSAPRNFSPLGLRQSTQQPGKDQRGRARVQRLLKLLIRDHCATGRPTADGMTNSSIVAAMIRAIPESLDCLAYTTHLLHRADHPARVDSHPRVR